MALNGVNMGLVCVNLCKFHLHKFISSRILLDNTSLFIIFALAVLHQHTTRLASYC